MTTARSTKTKKIAITLLFFFIAGLWEIGGGYLVWLWLRDGMSWMIGALGGYVLFMYGVVPTFQPSHFHRIYAAFGGIFIVSAIIWGRIVDKKKPNRYEIIGSLVAVIGAPPYSTLHVEDFYLNYAHASIWKSNVLIVHACPLNARPAHLQTNVKIALWRNVAVGQRFIQDPSFGSPVRFG